MSAEDEFTFGLDQEIKFVQVHAYSRGQLITLDSIVNLKGMKKH